MSGASEITDGASVLLFSVEVGNVYPRYISLLQSNPLINSQVELIPIMVIPATYLIGKMIKRSTKYLQFSAQNASLETATS